MDFEPKESVEEFRRWIRAFVAEHLTEEMIERARRTGTFHDWEFHRALAATGVIAEGMAGPGRSTGRDPLELYVFFDELGLADAPFFGLANTMLVAGIVEQIGSAFHLAEVLPRFHRGEAIAALGYSEPGSGSDVAAAATRAERILGHPEDEPVWLVNGQKMFTTLVHEAGYVILLTRTDPDVAKHRGLTMFLVPMDLPGISFQPVETMGGDRTNITYFTDVRVPDRWRLGEVDGGWGVMKVALAYERGVFGNMNQGVSLLRRFTRWAAETGAMDDTSVRKRLARIAIDNEITALLALRPALIASAGGLPTTEGSIAKLYASESYNRAAEACLDMAGPEGLLGEPGDAWFVDHAARDAPVTTIYGGTSEIQRNNIAEHRLGLPRAR
ncbi:acyl-CoA dehydrogenase family protein [Embleya sp. NPDC050154]|uniref:acyl-CoA dehydrogenase family protein n=1 Tax=unclassified Embleya TaxID=2699296 RepID=UPI00378C676A|nr:acyl-CoA dehydrogenase family protein [Embleya sp. NBC_00888]